MKLTLAMLLILEIFILHLFYLIKNESRSIVCQPDIDILITNLQKENIITKFTAEGLRNRAKKAYSSCNFFNKYLNGSTFISVEDAMYVQKMIGKEQTNRVIRNRDENQHEELRTIFCKRNLISRIIYCQNFDANGFGCRFSKLP